LRPYFKRIRFSPEQKRRWFFDREGVLFGFGFGFYYILRIPFAGVLMYGIAEASTAYLITKITDPPPAFPSEAMAHGEFSSQIANVTEAEFAESQTTWHNKKDFLQLPVDKLDIHNASAVAKATAKEHKDNLKEKASELKGKRFT
ncbi:hypothetical protein KEM55_001636, partial [Ascosphaera atra]